MLVIALDTAGPVCAAALARGERGAPEIPSRMSERIGRGHAERLIPMVDAVLQEAGCTYSELDRIAVTTGPGSFTGVRVGIAAARALALALDIPAVGVGSLAALASAAARGVPQGTVVAALDAKRGEVYALARDAASGVILFDAAAIAPEELAAALGAAARPLVLTGAGVPLLAALFPSSEARVAGTDEAPDIAEVARLGLAETPGAAPKPTYARGADAKPQAGMAVERA